jgi:hypothetical protein
MALQQAHHLLERCGNVVGRSPAQPVAVGWFARRPKLLGRPAAPRGACDFVLQFNERGTLDRANEVHSETDSQGLEVFSERTHVGNKNAGTRGESINDGKVGSNLQRERRVLHCR